MDINSLVLEALSWQEMLKKIIKKEQAELKQITGNPDPVFDKSEDLLTKN